MKVVVDLGTSRFRAGILNREEMMDEPNVVAKDISGRTIIGTEAERMIGRNPDLISVGYPMETGVIKDLEATVEVLKYALNRLRPGKFSRRYHLTISIPAGLTPIEKRALQDAGKHAGAYQVDLFESSIAAALGADLPIDYPTGCLVVDLGAGVTEVSLLSMGGVVESSQLRIGGRDTDRAIVEMIRKEFQFTIGERSAEQLKILCEDHLQRDQTQFEVRGRNLVTGLPDQLIVDRTLIKQKLEGYYETIVNLIVQTIETCPPELVGDIMDRGIVLVGGGANASSVLSSLSNKTQVPITIADSPDTCVFRGLQKILHPLSGAKSWRNWLPLVN